MEQVRCLSCGYDILWTPADPVNGMFRCPECGREHTNAELSRVAVPRRYSGLVWVLNIAVWGGLVLLFVFVVFRALI